MLFLPLNTSWEDIVTLQLLLLPRSDQTAAHQSQPGKSCWNVNASVTNSERSLTLCTNETEQLSQQSVRLPLSMPNIRFILRVWLCLSDLRFPKPGDIDPQVTTAGASCGQCLPECLGLLALELFQDSLNLLIKPLWQHFFGPGLPFQYVWKVILPCCTYTDIQ